MNTLTSIEEIRLGNLKLLHGTTSKFIAPTSDILNSALSEGGLNISKATLSNIYGRKKAIDDVLAAEIESALDLQVGWLSFNHNCWLKAAIVDLQLANEIISLPLTTKVHLSYLINLIKPDNNV